MKEHNDFVLELPNFVPASFCNHLIELFEENPRQYTGKIMVKGETLHIPELKSSTEICLCCDPISEKVFSYSKEFIENAVRLYLLQLKNEYDYDQKLHTFESVIHQNIDSSFIPTIQKQVRGGRYGWHFDGSLGDSHFVLVMVYLNTLEPHEGGCTEIGSGRKIRPECGKVMICPASWTYPHCGNEVKGESKYTMVAVVRLE